MARMAVIHNILNKKYVHISPFNDLKASRKAQYILYMQCDNVTYV